MEPTGLCMDTSKLISYQMWSQTNESPLAGLAKDRVAPRQPAGTRAIVSPPLYHCPTTNRNETKLTHSIRPRSSRHISLR